MTSPARRKGKTGELDAVAALQAYGWPARRRLLNGRRDDHGDIDGVPYTTIEVKWREDLVDAVRGGLSDLRREQNTPYGGVLIRRRGGRFIVVQELDQWHQVLADAIAWRRSR